MLNRLASASCLTIAIAIFPNNITLAESVDINFSGTVVPRASFGSYTPGKIESRISGKGGKSTNKFDNITPAKISVQTSNSTTIIVSSPELVSGSTDILDTSNPTLRVGSSQVSGDNITLPAGKNTVEVDIPLKPNQVFSPGTYNYAVTLTIVNP